MCLLLQLDPFFYGDTRLTENAPLRSPRDLTVMRNDCSGDTIARLLHKLYMAAFLPVLGEARASSLRLISR
jgi:hypothetical protein